MKHQIKVLQGVVGLLLSEGKGIGGTAFPKQPEKRIKLYDFEACPYCRRVRQALTELNLDYEVYPCPKGGSLYRSVAVQTTGVMQFPLLIDPNKDTVLQDSSEIIEYLFRTYGKIDVPPPPKWQNLPKKEIKGSLVSAISLLRGFKADKHNRKRIKNNKHPQELLELYSFEMSPYSRPVKERLCELEIAYVYRNVAKERWQDIGLATHRLKPGIYKPKRAGKRERIMNTVMNGEMQVPFLIDPNTDTALFESKKILDYLNRQYA